MFLSFFLAILNFGYFTIFGRYLRRFAFFFSTLANMCLSCRLYSWLLAPLLEICILHLNVVLFFFFFFCLNKTFYFSLNIRHAYLQVHLPFCQSQQQQQHRSLHLLDLRHQILLWQWSSSPMALVCLSLSLSLSLCG